NTEDFNKIIESRFKIYSNSTRSDYSNNKNLHKKAEEAFLNAVIGGDCLVIQRYENGYVTVQLIDGVHIATPMNLNFRGVDYVAANGNRVRLGVEIDDREQHVAYYVRSGLSGTDYERIPARGANDNVAAFLVYGLGYRLDTIRGIPLISAIMETAKKMERYKEATIGSAEERQKIPYAINHDATSTGENPLTERLAMASGFRNPADDIPRDINNQKLADRVAASTDKTVINMPIGAKLESLESENELHFKEFYEVNIELVCATVGIPPEVAMSKYDSNYSASRAAIKDWEHSLHVERKKFADQFYQNIYNLWLDVQVLTNKVEAPGYLTALSTKNYMVVDAYRNARFVGAPVPHIDPLKEVQAERLKLGSAFESVPLTTVEAATEVLNGGDSMSNIKQAAKELKTSSDEGIPADQNAQQDYNKQDNAK